MKFFLEEFKSNTDKAHVAVKDLSMLNVKEIERLIYNHVYTLKYVTKSKFISDTSIGQYVLGEKIVYIKEEEEIEGFSLILVHQHMNETQMLNVVNSDIKRFNSIMFNYFQDRRLLK